MADTQGGRAIFSKKFPFMIREVDSSPTPWNNPERKGIPSLTKMLNAHAHNSYVVFLINYAKQQAKE